MITDNEALAAKKIKEFGTLNDIKRPLEVIWQSIAQYCLPRKANITKKTYRPEEIEQNIFDTEPMDALNIAAAGMMSWTTPKQASWFAFEPPLAGKQDTKTKKWLADCAELIKEYLQASNFYTERHESLENKLAFGTSALYSTLENGVLRFENLDITTFCIKENAFGVVDTLMKKCSMTLEQAAQMFGYDNLAKEHKEQYDRMELSREVEFIHVVEPRNPRLISTNLLKAAKDKPFASYYIDVEHKKILRESGFDTFPYAVGRWLKYNNQIYPGWGYGPGFSALPEMRQLNYLAKMLDIYAGKITFPPLLVPDSYEGQLDTSMKAINYYSPEMGADAIAPMNVGGDISVAMNRIDNRRRALQAKFHTDLWQMLNNRANVQKTATEVMELLNEKVDILTPAFDRDNIETIEPILLRVFDLCASAGMLPQPPESAIIMTEGNVAEVANPRIVLTGRLALALRSMRNATADRQLQRLLSLAQFDPSVMDNFDLDQYAQDTSYDQGIPTQFVVDPEVRDEMRAQRAQAQQAQQAMAMGNETMRALGQQNVGRLIEESAGETAGMA
jgi:polyhydroxyalkanoate synthesis regulator phasin